MSTKTWQYLINPFLVATNSSYENAYRITLYHITALAAAANIPFFKTILDAYQPTHDAFVKSYNDWKQQGGQQISDTEHLSQLFDELTKKIKDWDIKIQNVYADTTPQYIRLLPHNRKPFQQGTQTSKLTALENLATALTGDASLAPVKTQVDAFYGLIQNVLQHQKTSLKTTGAASDTLENNRIAMCNAQFANYGTMITQYANNPLAIEGYFDLQHIRRSTQNTFTHQLAMGQQLMVVKRKLNPTDTLEIDNTGTTELLVWLSDKKDATAPATAVTIAADTNQTITANQLGDVAHNSYLIVKNNDAAHSGSFEVYFE